MDAFFFINTDEYIQVATRTPADKIEMHNI
jgi:hypothetical protein